MIRFLTLTLTALCLFAAPKGAEAQTRMKLTGNIHAMAVTVDKEGAIVVAVALANIGGKLGVCGLSWPEGASKSVINFKSDVLDNVVVELRGRALPLNGKTFPFYASEKEALASMARCATLNRPWVAEYAKEKFVLRLRSNRFRV
jgi:hypothetical protein